MDVYFYLYRKMSKRLVVGLVRWLVGKDTCNQALELSSISRIHIVEKEK